MQLKVFWSTLPRSIFTLFKSTAGGVSWHDVVVPLSAIGWPYVALFTMFIALFSFAILNVVTAVFCQSAIASAQRDKDMATLSLLDEKAVIIRKLTELFEAIDEDESGLITMDEIEQVLSEQFTHAYLESLGITTTDAWTLV